MVDPLSFGKDFHFAMECVYCHKGDDKKETKESSHKGFIARPSDNIQTCGICHKKAGQNYSKSLHYTSMGQREGVKPRFSHDELNTFDTKVFNQSCRSCHASCGDCHVKSPPVSGITTGLISGHKFVKKNEGKTCASCHGGRVYPEFTGEYGGTPDVHYQKSMMCVDCHKKSEMHGDGIAYKSKQEVKDRPKCLSCHKNRKYQVAHELHKDTVTCQACHSSGQYRQCSSCHTETGSTAKPDFILGLNPRDNKTLTTLRLIPTIKSSFHQAGIKMENFDALPNYWNSAVHNITKRTARTRSCDSCHVAKEGFLKRETLIKDGSKANEGLIYNIKPTTK
jgi:hypothetical protein